MCQTGVELIWYGASIIMQGITEIDESIRLSHAPTSPFLKWLDFFYLCTIKVARRRT